MKPRRLRDLGCKRTAVPTRVSTSISCENLRMRARIAPARGDVRTPPVISAPMTWARVAPAQGDGRIPSAISAPRTRARARIAPAPAPSAKSAPRTRARIAPVPGDGRFPSGTRRRGRGRGLHPRGEMVGSRRQTRRRGRGQGSHPHWGAAGSHRRSQRR